MIPVIYQLKPGSKVGFSTAAPGTAPKTLAEITAALNTARVTEEAKFLLRSISMATKSSRVLHLILSLNYA